MTDFGFKKLFGSEPNKDLLMDFLNQILPEKHKIAQLSYSPHEQLGLGIMDRKAIFDLYCTSDSGERFIVELQKAKQDYFKDRSVYYASFPIQEQAKRGEWNYQLDAVYTVGILDFVFNDHKEESELIHFVELKNQHCQTFFDKLQFIYIELPKFTKEADELETHFDKWLYVFRYLAILQNRPKQLQEKIFVKLFESAEIAKFSMEDRNAYKQRLKHYNYLKNAIDSSERAGLERGMKQGIQIGMDKGMKQGIEQVAKKMKDAGLAIEQITELTGLSAEEIDQL
ncbi:MAG: Rpn family recombination-promoting nuclease/putative transposase [Bacteroidota bacterium]